MIVKKYVVIENFVILDMLFLKGDKIFMEDYYDRGALGRRVFKEDREFIGILVFKQATNVLYYLEKVNS